MDNGMRRFPARRSEADRVPRRMHSRTRGICGAVAAVVCLVAVGCGSDSSSRRAGDPTSEDFCASAPVAGYGFDRYGGWKRIQAEATGRFRVTEINGVWWLITPDGHGFFSNGPTGIDFIGDFVRSTDRSPYRDANLARHGSPQAWADATLERLCDLGIRSIGGWVGPSDLDLFRDRIAYAVNIDFYDVMPRLRTGPASFKPRRDVFDPDAEQLAATLAAEGGLLRRCAADPWCIGAYVENEVPYAPSLIAGGGHLEAYLSLPPGSPAKVALQEFFEVRHAGDVASFNQVWGTQFLSFDALQGTYFLGDCPPIFGFEDEFCYLMETPERWADRYGFEAHVAGHLAEMAAAVLRSVEPQMLNLGPRIVVAPFAPQVLEALAAPADVMSVNNYDISSDAAELLGPEYAARLDEFGMLSFDPFERLHRLFEITGKPILITEWFYRRARPDVTSFPPFLPEVADAEAQAEAYRRYMDQLLTMPFVIGQHWFQWVDQPIEGRGDGENQLIGIVDVGDDLNQPLADSVAEWNAATWQRRLRLRR